jgi:hypothetical protein
VIGRLACLLVCFCATWQAPASAAASAAEAASPLVGTWQIVEDQSVDAQGTVTARDRDVVGLLVYTPEGRMAVQLMYRNGRPVVSADDDVASDGVGLGHIGWSGADAKAAIDTYDAYFGTYTVDAARRTVVHHVHGELRPYGVGTRYERRYELRGDELWLMPADPDLHWRAVWKRVR